MRTDNAPPVEGIIALTRDLVRVPSQGGIDSLHPMIDKLAEWLSANELAWQEITDSSGSPVAVLVTVDSGQPGPTICLDAPIDTAPAGKVDSWNFPPFSATISGSRMYGRGVADAKVGAAIFCHVARDLQRANGLRKGKLLVLLDGDEHTGRFGGVKAFVENYGYRPDFVAVGYPGNFGVKIGARGFYRATVNVYGTERHSGSQADTRAQNAILKMARVIQELSAEPLPPEAGDFSFGPKLSITEVAGGYGFSQIPGVCTAKVDARLTPSFTPGRAKQLIEGVLARVDSAFPTERRSGCVDHSTWPAYKLDSGSAFVDVLRRAAASAFSKNVELVVCGPSNIGNYLATHGIPSTCGFGVSYDHQHAANEYIELETIGPTYRTYRSASEDLALL